MMENKKIIEKHVKRVKEFAETLPGITMIHNAQNNFQRLEYISNRGLDFLQTTQEYLTALGHEYYIKYFNQDDIWQLMDDMQAMLKRRDPNEIYTFYHQARPNEHSEWTWFLNSMKILAFDDEGSPMLTITFAVKLDPNYSVTYKVDKVLEEKLFTIKNKQIFETLSGREKEILEYVAKGLTSEEISLKCNISVETVKTHRKNINYKINAKSLSELQNFARAFNMI